MKKSFFFYLVGVLTPVVAGYIFLVSGGMPVATKGPPLPLEKRVARIALHAATRGSETLAPPFKADTAALRSGAKVYVTNCAVCHGVPEGRPTTIAKGLFPKPPQLFTTDENVTDDPAGKVYWKVKNGIRLTGMPGFGDELSETEMWQVSELLIHPEPLPQEVRDILK